MMPEEALLELIRATRDDVANLRDNHLSHMKDDIQEIKETVCDVGHRVTSIESTINTMKTHWWKIASVVIFGIFGMDIGSEMLT
jgi:hypothetical protein